MRSPSNPASNAIHADGSALQGSALEGSSSDPWHVAHGSVSGFGLDNTELSESMERGLARVEQQLRQSVSSEFDFATRTSLHLVDAGGKRFRPLFALLAAHFGDHEREDVVKAASVVELVHLATLYHDDVMDEATIRRGASSANARWDNSVAILTGDLLFAQASILGSDLGTDAARILSETFAALVTGQMRETAGHPLDELAVDHYFTVVYEKTGSLIATAGQFGAWFAGVEQPHVDTMWRIGRALGIGFQISDDIIDIASPATTSGKKPGADLRAGVRTLPVLYALTSADTDPRLKKLLSGPIGTDAEVAEALDMLRESSALAQARATLEEYADSARQEVAALPECRAREALEAVVDLVVSRTT